MSAFVTLAHDGDIALITLQRPEKRNAFHQPLREQLAHTLEAVADDAGVKAAVITGAGSHFSVGGDIDGLAQATSADIPAILGAAHRCIRAIRQSGKGFVAAIEGSAAGGAAGLALACDAIVMADDAQLVLPFLKLGLVPDWGCVPLLRARVGEGHARRLLLQPSRIDADQASRLGLADEVCPAGHALARAMTLAHTFADQLQPAWGLTKSMLNTPADSLDDALAQERECQSRCIDSDAFRSALNTLTQARRGTR